MQTPEKLSLIGGSILLASTLVFTLKSQASDIIPKVNDGMYEMLKSDNERQQEQNENKQKQAEQSFNNSFQQAQQKGEQIGYWGTAKFYVDNQNAMHVGSGQLNGSFSKLVNDKQIKIINLDENVQAPQDSSYLFADGSFANIPLTQINGLSNLDTSQTTSMYGMFESDGSLNSFDVSHFDTSKVTNMINMFNEDSSLSNLNLSNWNTANMTDTGSDIFENDYDIQQLILGPNTKLTGAYLTGTYQSNSQELSGSQLSDGNVHPGTWIKQ